MIDLKNLNIIVTGATGIIGNSILEKLILGGSNILATGTNEEKLAQIKNKYENINTLKFDISKHNEIEKFADSCNTILSNKIGLDVSHVGFLLWDNEGNAIFRHASSKKKYMKVIDEDFFEYIKNKPGIIIYKTN